ncbi:LysR family transcriptional regulator [Colidextribacter sp. OB.20]|uniref:NTP transferase domain-containing protein n=1 Tax=Colidextribacter sp. OB.20 TaxID=2304568 RepID=UPI00136EEFF9|nr:NTP transferase domain-containing protein [Colidextribacter sp. OB.20]NBI09757.1 LysR family transcriptional regulator [Colidextribacter sp. OB.20]
MSELAGLILAAGVSSRMGAFKPMLPVDGKTMIRRVAEMMCGAGADPVVVVTGYQGGTLEGHLKDLGLRFVHNERYYETQMLDSLLLGLEQLEGARRVLVSPADIPLVEQSTVEALLAAEGDFVRPLFQGTPGHPVVLSQKIFQGLRSYSGSGGLKGAIEALGVPITDVTVEDQGTALDSDTRDEYAALLKYRRRQTDRPQPLQLETQVCLRAETSFFGLRSAQFLELIQTTGSMLSACQCMHMSYSKGWTMINEMERQLGWPVLIRSQGGSNGGGSSLTRQGSGLLSAYRELQADILAYSQEAFQKYFGNMQ